jgi:NADH-quinone oxidoreductase subunit N
MEELIQNNLQSLAWFRPELVLAAGTMLLFVLDMVWRGHARRVQRLTTASVAVLGAAAVLLALQPGDSVSLFNGMIATDAFATFFKWMFLAAGILTVIIAAQGDEIARARSGEFQALMLAVVLGMFLMASATNLLAIYLAIELVSLVSYVLAGYRRGDRKAAEGSLKYVIYGGVASGTMLFGMSWLYGLLGTTDLSLWATRLSEVMARTQVQGPAAVAATKLALIASLVFVLAGIGYKIAAVPWHMWCPDVYEGAPTPFTAFLSVGPKAAGFALALRLFYGTLAGPSSDAGFSEALAGIPWPAVAGVISAITMTLGNVTALVQDNLKRLLAYSSIAHAGYALMGVAAASVLGTQGVMIYMLVYLVMNLGAFLAVIVIAQATGSESIHDARGLARRHPLAAVAFAIFLFSLTGLPPFAGFTGKWFLFYAVLERGGTWYVLLALVGALNTAVSLFYYARIVRAMFLEAPRVSTPVEPRVTQQVLLAAFSALILVFGIWWNPLVSWSKHSLAMFHL